VSCAQDSDIDLLASRGKTTFETLLRPAGVSRTVFETFDPDGKRLKARARHTSRRIDSCRLAALYLDEPDRSGRRSPARVWPTFSTFTDEAIFDAVLSPPVIAKRSSGFPKEHARRCRRDGSSTGQTSRPARRTILALIPNHWNCSEHSAAARRSAAPVPTSPTGARFVVGLGRGQTFCFRRPPWPRRPEAGASALCQLLPIRQVPPGSWLRSQAADRDVSSPDTARTTSTIAILVRRW